MTDSYAVHPLHRPISGTVRPPGSKSITNRALIIAALADGETELTGALASDDTRVMLDSLIRLGIEVEHDLAAARMRVVGCGGRLSPGDSELWLQNSGTSIRFLTAMCTLGQGTVRLTGNSRMQERPIQDLADALNALGANVTCEQGQGCPPVLVQAAGLPGGTARVRGTLSSQFLSALLMAAPAAAAPVTLEIDGELVSKPYLEMTLDVMRATVFAGQDVEATDRARSSAIEPDASAASYFFAVAAITGGTVTVPGLSRDALQGDVHFAAALEQMGCQVQWQDDAITVTGPPELRGIDIDMNAISDTAQTLAVVAAFASSPTRIRNVAHMRHKETDRIAAVVQELQRAGIVAEEHDDGLTITPGPAQPAEIHTYDDHRMAMSFALLGLRNEGILIADPGCTAKTYPHFLTDLETLCGIH